MDVGRVVYAVTQVYVGTLLVISAITLAWIFDLFEQTQVRVAGIWFGVSGFGVLVVLTILMVHFSRG